MNVALARGGRRGFDSAMKLLPRVLAGCLVGCSLFAADSPSDYRAYVGTYTGAKSKGIYVAPFDSKTGRLGTPELAAEVASPSFLAVHPNHRFLYAVNEVASFGGKKSGAVTAFAIDRATGKLRQLNQQPSMGDGPCHLAVDSSGRSVLIANYGGGSVASLPIREDGSLGEPGSFVQHHGSSVNPSRQKGPHGHCILPDPSNRFALACDLGLDQVLIYRLDPANGTLTAHDPAFASTKPGAGPRHLAFRPDGKFAYVINEMDCTMTAFAWDPARGALQEVQTLSTLPGEIQRGYSTAEVAVHPNGRFVYGSNRGHDTIAVFTFNEDSGRLTLVQNAPTQGRTPRHFAIDPHGKFLFAENQGSDTIVGFTIDPQSGKLEPSGVKVEVGSPVCLVFVPAKP